MSSRWRSLKWKLKMLLKNVMLTFVVDLGAKIYILGYLRYHSIVIMSYNIISWLFYPQHLSITTLA